MRDPNCAVAVSPVALSGVHGEGSRECPEEYGQFLLGAILLSPRVQGCPSLARRASAEALGTGLLLAAVVGSGIMGERLSGGNIALALLANSVATGAALVAILLSLGEISGRTQNWRSAWSDGMGGEPDRRDVRRHLLSQCAGPCSCGSCRPAVMLSEPVLPRVAPVASRPGPVDERSRRDVRAAERRLGLCTHAPGQRTIYGSAPTSVWRPMRWFTSSTSLG